MERQVTGLWDADESFLRKFTLPVEDWFRDPNRPPWNGGHGWFRSPNVVDLQRYRTPAEKQRICVNLLHHPAWRSAAVKSA
jgi:hypothetical protein